MMSSHRSISRPDPTEPIAIPYRRPIPVLIRQWARQAGDRIAIRREDRCWTYRELVDAADAIARALIEAGISSGSVVAVSGESSFGLMASLLAVFRSGGVLLALDPKLPPARQLTMLRISGARCVLAAGAGLQVLDAYRDADARIRVELDTARILDQELSASRPLPVSLPDLAPEQPAYIFFTSGTTGTPKGVLGTHRGMSHFLHWQRETFSVSPEDRVAPLTSLSFDVVLRDIFLALSSGATLCLPPEDIRDAPPRLLEWLSREKISILHLVPTLARHWLDSSTATVRLSDLRLVFFAGEPLTGKLVKQWRGVFSCSGTVINLYGPTETTLAKCYYVVEDSPGDGVIPIGQPLPETQALVLSEAKTLCEIGEIGEIVLRTPYRTLGYINAPEEQARRFVPNHFLAAEADLLYYTGDLGRYRADGCLEILGRRDHQIKIRGVRIETGEIEAVLTRHPAVRQAVATLKTFPSGEDRLVAYLVLARDESPGAGELRQLLGETLPAVMIPSGFVVLEELPRTSSGKIDYLALPLPEAGPLSALDTTPAPRDALESQLLRLWEELFDRRPIGLNEDFFELGGTSLLAVRLFSEIEALFGRNLPLATLFKASRLIDLANILREQNWLAPWSSLVPIRPAGKRPPLFYIHAGGGNLLIYRELAAGLSEDQPVYGLQPRGLDGILDPLRTVEEMADHYLAQVFRIQPVGPYFLAGLSSGGIVALEMAQRLQARGQVVALLAMFDTTGPQGYLPLALPNRVCSVLAWYATDRLRGLLHVPRRCIRAARSLDIRHFRGFFVGRAAGTRRPLEPDQRRQREKAHTILARRLEIYRAERSAGIAKLVDSLLILLLRNSSRPFFAGILAEGVAYPATDGGTGRLRWIQEISDQASRMYAPSPYQGKITYFQAKDSPPGVRPAPMGGWSGIAAGGIEIRTIPGDHTAIMKSPELARQLRECLERAQG